MTDEPERPKWKHRKDDLYVVLFGDWYTVGTYGQPNYRFERSWAWRCNRSTFTTHGAAKRAGMAWQQSDDFNIGVIRDGVLFALLWMDEWMVDEEPSTLAEIVEMAGLDCASPEEPPTVHNASNRDYERVWTDPDAPIIERLSTHRYDGLCPDAVEGWDARDPACEACKLVDRIGEALGVA